MMGQKDRSLAALPPVTLDAFVPPDHCYRHLERTLDLACVRDLVRDAGAGGLTRGPPAGAPGLPGPLDVVGPRDAGGAPHRR